MGRKKVILPDIAELRKSLPRIPQETRPIAAGLCDELEFMQKTLATLKAQVAEEGPTAMFRQGKQEFLREHPALKAYNTTVQRYSLLYRQLADLLPETPPGPKTDPLIDFVKAAEK